MSLKITLNGDDCTGIAEFVQKLVQPVGLDELGYAGAVVATALNEDFVPRDKRPETTIHDGDRLEVVAPLQGG